MQAAKAVLCFLLAAHSVGASSDQTGNPITKVIQMLSDLQAKIIKEGDEAQKVYEEFAEWCEDRARELQWQIKGVKENVDKNHACDVEQEDICADCQAKLEKCTAELKKDQADLKAAQEIRAKEADDFGAEEAELLKIIDILERAIAILEREMSKTSMLQVRGAANVADALKVIVQGLDLSVADSDALTAFVQSSSQADASDEGEGAPDPSAYKNKSGGIVEELTKLLEKARAQLDELRKKETADQMNFEILVEQLKGEIEEDEKCIKDSKSCLGECKEQGTICHGEYLVDDKELKLLEKELADLHKECMQRAQDFEMEVKSRAEELKALAGAKKVIKESTGGEGGAEDLTYSLTQEGAVSLLQIRSGVDLANFEVVRFVRDLARKQRSPALAQLATRIGGVMRSSSVSGEDPFAKVKNLIRDMIEKLLKEAEEEAAHKAYCDKEMGETKAKKEDKTDEIEKLSTKIDQATSRFAQLKNEVAALQKELSELAASQAEMDRIRSEEKAVFETSKAELTEGLEGIQLALKILREYYAKGDKAHSAQEGASTGIIGLLEVVESDISKELAEVVSVEESAVAKYDQQTKENEILKVTMEQDVKYKTKEMGELDEAVAEATSDRAGVQAELDAVLKYLSELEDQCIAKPEPYEERVRRREAEISGLKQALEILNGEAMLLQRSAVKRLRGLA